MRVRRQRWRVIESRGHAACSELALAGAGASNDGLVRRVLSPFDRVEPLVGQPLLRRAGSSAWRRTCRDALAERVPPASLRAAHASRIELRPHQLEPALAVARGHACRLLLADAVGLGKTIQAALVVCELKARGLASRVLVLTPAGLRDQWAGELSDRFDLPATVIDGPELRTRVARLPYSVNPWTTTAMAIASIDYVKQGHVLPAVASCPWDIVIVDEAHGVAAQNERRRAVGTLASRALYVLLLSATPHSGDRQRFADLCALGSHGDPILVFRRKRGDVSLGIRRRVHQLRVRVGPAERRMHRLLESFGRAVRRERRCALREIWLALAVLHKRALSSPFALARSVERRLETVGLRPPMGDDRIEQLTLPWIDTQGEGSIEDAPPEWPSALSLDSVVRERSLLERLASAAVDAAAESSKLSALRRLLRRAGQPAIVFTEYRDTLEVVRRGLGTPAAVLHGGLSRADRHNAVSQFTSGREDLLLATDAAAEGLNLHARCRLVVNLELPWNPMRLEQRVGRVDRIGQSATVHAIHLIAADTAEARLLAGLRTKMARVQADIGADDPLDGSDEAALARFAIAGIRPQASTVGRAAGPTVEAGAIHLSLSAEATTEASRLGAVRRLLARNGPRSTPAASGPWFVRSRNGRTRERLAGRALVLFRAWVDDATGRPIASTIVPVAIAGRQHRFDTVESAGDTLRRLDPFLRTALVSTTMAWWEGVVLAHQTIVDTAITRARLVAAAASGESATSHFQPQLFSRRADLEHAQRNPWLRDAGADHLERLARLQALRSVSLRSRDLLLVIAP